jgi:hypothetical protein
MLWLKILFELNAHIVAEKSANALRGGTENCLPFRTSPKPHRQATHLTHSRHKAAKIPAIRASPQLESLSKIRLVSILLSVLPDCSLSKNVTLIAHVRALLSKRRQRSCSMEDEGSEGENEDTQYSNAHGIDLDALPECGASAEVAWLDLNGLTAKEALGLNFERSSAEIRKYK